MLKPVRIGVAGCGMIGRIHLQSFAMIPSAHVVALADHQPSRLDAALAYAPSATLCSDYAEMIQLQNVDAVLICLPSGLHAEAATAALEQAKHLYLEKPIAHTQEGADAVLEAWQKAGVVGMVGLNYRFHPLIVRMRELVSSQQFGRILRVESENATPLAQLTGWREDRSSGGGVLLDLASHHMDLIPYLLNCRIKRIEASGDLFSANVRMEMENGALVDSSFRFGDQTQDRITIYAENGTLAFDRHRSLWLKIEKRNGKSLWAALQQCFSSSYALRKIARPDWDPSFEIALRVFVHAVQDKQPCLPDLKDGYNSLRAVLAAERRL